MNFAGTSIALISCMQLHNNVDTGIKYSVAFWLDAMKRSEKCLKRKHLVFRWVKTFQRSRWCKLRALLPLILWNISKGIESLQLMSIHPPKQSSFRARIREINDAFSYSHCWNGHYLPWVYFCLPLRLTSAHIIKFKFHICGSLKMLRGRWF